MLDFLDSLLGASLLGYAITHCCTTSATATMDSLKDSVLTIGRHLFAGLVLLVSLKILGIV